MTNAELSAKVAEARGDAINEHYLEFPSGKKVQYFVEGDFKPYATDMNCARELKDAIMGRGAQSISVLIRRTILKDCKHVCEVTIYPSGMFELPVHVAESTEERAICKAYLKFKESK